MIIPTGAGAPYMAFMRADCKCPFGCEPGYPNRHTPDILQYNSVASDILARPPKARRAYAVVSPRN